ncbi:unnamed protein product [Rhizophagus irregularis]|nr:unnamed protein product [Rhizophagus irregularis]
MSFNSSNSLSVNEAKTNIIIKDDDENFLKNFLKEFYQRIIEINDINNFENITNEWINNYIKNNNKNPEKILKLMENHDNNIIWFTSSIGFFYQFGIGCNLDKKKSIESYYLSINNIKGKNYLNNYYFNELNFIEEYDDDNDLFNVLRYKNVIIGKYLLSLFYYKDIILDINFKQNELSNLLKLAENDDLEAN